MKFFALVTLVLGAVLQAAAQVKDPAQAAAIVAQLSASPTSATRFNLLNGREFVFDFNAGVGTNGGLGGNITIANIGDFPYLIGKGMSLTYGRIAPCGLSTPHYHPRATEFLYMLTGQELQVGFLQENGARLVVNTVYPGQGTIFPKGSFHYLSNPQCGPVTYVAGLNAEDPGVASVAQRFFGLQPDSVDATLGDIGFDEVVKIANSIPDTFALGVKSCLDKCKITRGDQPKTQQQPRGGGNELNKRDEEFAKRDDDLTKRGDVTFPDFTKRSYAAGDRVTPPTTPIYSIFSSADAQILGELVFFLKLVLGVLLAGYFFVWAYFIIPTWRNRRIQAELQARAAIPPSVPVQDVKS